MADHPSAKVCNGCGEIKPLDQFSPMQAGLYGRTSKCRRCCATAQAKRNAAKRIAAGRPPPQPKMSGATLWQPSGMYPSSEPDRTLNRAFTAFLRIIARPGDGGNLSPVA